ncbi:response regulator [Diaphorobacter caeni]|uniref:response regulator n=1 Tax=Diaphorobacter caeni TaxID=2784387 RepID=UPI00188FCBD0|nr:response regulator transcription factor [Diaphorobacter caeni]MBF5006823.1 response regulator transcription factor [Diaphorobacter caeni]
MIQIMIVDDHGILRSSIKQYLSEHVDFRCVGEAATVSGAIALVTKQIPDVLILDLVLPDGSGVDAITRIQEVAPNIPILIFTGHPEEHYAVNVFRQGVRGYLNKSCSPDELAEAIRKIALNGRYVSQKVANLLAQNMNRKSDKLAHELLSERESVVFLKLASGDKAGEIADNLGLSVKTVSTYRTRLLEKMGLTSNSDLTYYALKNGLLT